MAALLLAIIYIAFVSLGLPDALLGAGWPVMQAELGVPYGFAGLASIVICAGTILSSISSSRVLKRFGTGFVTAFSVALTALALFGFSVAPSFWWIVLAAVPLGLGAGAVDAGLNAYVAAHYESRHMSWLHSFWGWGRCRDRSCCPGCWRMKTAGAAPTWSLPSSRSCWPGS